MKALGYLKITELFKNRCESKVRNILYHCTEYMMKLKQDVNIMNEEKLIKQILYYNHKTRTSERLRILIYKRFIFVLKCYGTCIEVLTLTTYSGVVF